METHAQRGLQSLLGAFIAAQPEARPVLRRFFFLYATRDVAAEVPEAEMVAAALAVAALRDACERGDYQAALEHLREWAGLLGVPTADLAGAAIALTSTKITHPGDTTHRCTMLSCS